MEFESSGVETGCIENEEIIQPGCSCVVNRKSSRNKKNKLNKPSRHSWHDFHHVDYGDQPKTQEGCGKKRKIELVEKDGSLQAEEIELCRKSLLEAILRLNRDNVDLQSCTLLELVTQLASLSEAQENVVTKMRDKSAEDGEKISDLEKLLMKRKLEIDSLSAGKDELESFLKIEKEKYVNIDNQLKVALHKLEAVSKEINSFPNGNVDNVCELSSLTIENKTLTIVEQDLVSENIDIKIEKCTLQTKRGDEIDIRDAELKEALSKISMLIEENKRLENTVQLQEKNKSYLQKFKEKLVNIEEMLKKNEAELLRVCCDEDNMMCNLSLNKVSQNVKDQSNEPLMVLEHIPGGLNEPSEGTSSSEEICLKNRGGEVSLEEELYSKVNILDCLYNLTEQYSIKLRQEVERAEGLETELKQALEKITSLAHNVKTPTGFEISSKIIKTEQSVVAFDAVMEPVQAKSLVTVQDTVETTLIEELGNSHHLQNNLLEAANKLDHLSKELEETIAQAQKENEKLRLHLEQEKLKVSAFEFSLEEKNQELEKLMQKEKELQSVLVANDAKTEADMKTLLSRVADINAQKLEAEEREYKVKCDMKKYKEELTVLESRLEDYKKQTISLTSSNKEFESLISLEKKSSQEVKCQLQVAMDKIDALSKELAHTSEKSKSKEEELLIRLNEETEKVVRMGDEIHSKIVALENLNIVMEEYKLQLNEERTNYKLMEKELKESLAKNAKEINSESTKSFEGHCIKVEKLNIQANAVKGITEVKIEEELHVQKDTFYSSSNGTVEEQKLGESLQIGFEETLNYNLAYKDNEAGIICESSNQEMLDADMLLKFKEKISILETELEKSKLDLDEIVTEKNKFESILKDEGEKLQNTEKELKNALNQIDVLTKDLTAISAQLREEIERHKQLKEELEDSEVVVANLAISEEEFIIQLKEMARDRKNLEEDLKEAREKILSLCEENNRLICERAAREEERMAIAFHHGEKISRLETTISEHKSQIYRISCDKNESEIKKEMESSSEIVTYKERISELERIAEESASIISRLDIEKDELESLLISEKENCQKISSELSEALANLQSSLEIIPGYEKEITKLERVVAMNESEISKLGIEKGELESMLISEKENCQKISSALSEALANLEIIPAYEKKITELEDVVARYESEISKLGIEKGELESLLISEKENCQKISSQLSEALANLQNSSEIIPEYEKKNAELEDVVVKNESEISKLGIEKGELESMLISEKENCQKISSALSEALANLEIIPAYEKKITELEDVVARYESEISKLGIEKGELESLLISEKENCQKISSQLSEALANLQNSSEIIPEYEKKNAELEDVVVKNESEISKLGIEKGELESMLISEKENCQKISSELSEALANLEIIPAYEKKITELDDVVARYESEISKLGVEKGELELLLISEKENCQKISSQLSETLANLQNSLEIIPEYEKKITELEKVVVKNESEISKLTIEKGELESMLISEKENCQKVSSELSETLANLQSSLEIIPGYEKEITKLERVVAMNESEISKLDIEKGELESLLISEKEDCKKTSSELTEALANLENLTKELNESSAKNKDAEELASLLDMETQKVRKLEEEIETKREELLNLANKGEELIILLNEEKHRKQELEAKFLNMPSDAINDNSVEYTPCGNEYCNETEPSEEISEYKKKIVELENLALRNEDDISRLGIEKRELESLLVSEKENHEKIVLQLSEALGSLDKITEDMNQSSAKQREAEELSSVLKMNIQKISSMEEELETKGKDLQNLTNKLEELTAETSDKILGYERKIGELEELAARNGCDISRLCNEKKELESLLLSEKENHQKLTLQLDEALFNLENVTITLNESSAKNKNVEEMSSQLKLEMQGVRQLEEELNAKKEGLENVNNKLEELTVQLAEEKRRREELEAELQKIRVNELIENSYEGGEFCNHADASEKISGYEQKIVELEETVLNNAANISRLSIEKSELESLLVLEKENSQKIYLELSGALGILDNVTKELNESSAKDKNAEELSSLLDIEKQKVLKLEEELETKKEDSENLVSKLEELSKCLSDEKRRKEEIEVELQKLLAKVPSENSSQETQTDVRLCYDEEVSEKVLECDDTISISEESAVGNEPEIVRPIVENEELESLLDFEKKGAQKVSLQLCEVLLNPENESEKISTYERKIVELEELAVRNAYDISRLGVEKGEIESLLVLEKENIQNISLQLSEALVNLDNITKELNESSAKNMNVEELSSQLDTQILKVREMEEELKTKDVTLAKYSNEQEELTSLLTEEREKVRKLENESERKMEDLEKLSIKAEEYLSQLQDQLVTTENKDLEIKDLLAKVSSYEEEAKRLNALEIESRMKNSEQVARISELEVLVEEGKTEISSMVAKNDELESCLNSEKEASQSLSSQLKDALEKIESLFSEIRNISDNCKIQEEELCSNKSAMEKLSEEYGLKLKEEKERSESLDKEMSQILIDLSNLKEEKEHLIAEHRERENSQVVQLEELETLLQQSRSELSSLTSENKQLVASLASKKDQLECIQHQLDCALQEIDNITKKLNELSDQLQSNQSKESVILSSIKSELESAKCALSVRAKSEEELINLLSVERCRVEDLHNQLSEEMTKREELVGKNLELTNSTDVIKQKLALLVEDYTKSSENELKLMATNEQQSAELEVLKVKLNSSELEIQKLEAELNSKISDNTKMENRYMELAEQVESLKVLMEQSKSELSSLTLEKDELVVNLESKNVQLEVVQTQLAGSLQDVDNLMKKLKETSNQLLSKERVESEILISMKAELEQAKYALSVCASSEEELDNLLSLEKIKVNGLCKQLSEETAKREEVVAKNLELASSLENIKQQLALLLEEHRKSNENELSLITANEELSGEVNRLNANLDSSRLEIEKLEAELNAKMNDIPIIENRNVELTEQMEALKNLLEQGKSEISSLTIEKNNLAINLKSKTDQLESVQHQLDCSSQEIDSLTKKLAELSNQMEGNKDKESEIVSSVKAELESAKCALLVHAKNEDELNSLLSTERNKVDDLIKQLKEDISKREEVVNTNLELTTSIKAVEQQLTTVLGDFKKSSEKELKLMASIEEMTAKVTELETKLNSTKSENEKLEADLKVKIDDISVSEKRNLELASLLESSSKKITELETCTKEMNQDLQLKVIEANNCFEKISQLQSALGKAEGQICSMSLELEQAKDHKEIEDVLRAEISQIGAALQEANDRIEKISEARVTELENERSSSKKIISKLEEQIVVTNQELKGVLKLNEGKISALESELKAEQEKFALKMEEFSLLQLNKNELSELLKAEKSRVSTLENKILKDEEKLRVLEEKMDRLKAEVSTRVKENSRLKTMENELRADLEMERKKSLVAENEIVQLQTSLLASQLKQGELKSNINRLEIRLQEEISLGIQLRTQFDNEKKAHSSAKEAEMRMLAVVSAQEKALSLLEVAKEGAGSEIRMLNDAIQEKEKQLKELAQTLEEQEQYSKSMEQTVEKMERRNNILLDHRIQIQNNAKANEEKLMAEIAELQRRLDDVSKSGPGKGDVVEFEKNLKEERLRREEVENKLRSALLEVKNYHTQVEEYKREIMRCKQLIFGGAKGQDPENFKNVKEAAMVDCGVQTVPTTLPQVQNVCFDGNGAGQGSNIKLLEQKVKKLEEDKEFLKKLCRRRHEQREELKLQLEALSSKPQPAPRLGNKENLNSNV